MLTDPFNLGDLIDRSQDQSRTAIIDLRIPDQPRAFSYAEMDSLAGGVASDLKNLGFAPGARIAIASLNRAEYIACYFGIMRAGMVAVPVNIKLPLDIIDFIIEDADVALTFTDDPARAKFAGRVDTLDFDDIGHTGSMPS